MIRTSLIQLRHEHNITIRELSKILKVNQRTLCRWLSGEREPSLKHLKVIVDRFKIYDVYQFAYGDRPKEIPKLVYID